MEQELDLDRLGTLTAELGTYHDLGPTAFGRRFVVDATAATLELGDVRATLASRAAADWATLGTDRSVLVDVRMTLSTEDGKLVQFDYNGVCAEVGAAPIFVSGRMTGIDALANTLIVGKGAHSGDMVSYQLYGCR